MALVIRALHPQIESRTHKKRHKPFAKYKENRKFAYQKLKREHKIIPHLQIYAEMTKQQQNILKINSIRHSLRATKGETSKMRTIRRRRRKEYLRLKYKLQNRTKVCTICEEDKALSDFDYQKDSRHKYMYRRTYCYVCRKRMNAEAYQRRKNDTNATRIS